MKIRPKMLEGISLFATIFCFMIVNVGLAAETINVIAWPTASTHGLKILLPEFTKATGIKVNLELAPEPVLHEKVALSYARSTGDYDVAMIGMAQYPEFAAAGYVENLDPYVKNKLDPRWLDMDDFFPGFLDSLRVDGKLYALPFYVWGGCLMYRKDLFEKYNVKVPKTITEFAEAAKKLTVDTDGDGKIDVYGLAERGTKGPFSTLSMAWIYSFGGEFLDEHYRPAFTSPEALKAVKLYVDLLKKYGAPGQANYNWMETVELFTNGKAAMMIEASDFAGRVNDPSASKVAGKVGYAVMPQEKRPSGYIFCAGWALASASKHKDAAWQFMQWSTSNDVGVKTIDTARTDAPNRSVWQNEEYHERHPYSVILTKCLNEAHPFYFPQIPEYTEIVMNYTSHVSEAIAGHVSVEEALNESSKEISEILKDRIAKHK